MADELFLRADRPLLTQAVAQALTHSQMSMYETRYRLDTAGAGNKEERARLILEHVLERTANPTREALDLLDYAFIDNTPRPFPGDVDRYDRLEKRVLSRRGIVKTEDGFVAQGSPAREEPETEVTATPVASSPPTPASAGATVPEAHVPPADDTRQVFVVHGRDTRPVGVVQQFLTYLGLRMMSWSDARRVTGKTQPTTYEIVLAGMQRAAAIIVIFSPDEDARLRSKFTDDGSLQTPEGQPRQNVLLEAGMAHAMAPDKTVFVQSERVREISDIAGFNWVSLDGKFDSRLDLKQRLAEAGCSVHSGDFDLMADAAGPFCVT